MHGQTRAPRFVLSLTVHQNPNLTKICTVKIKRNDDRTFDRGIELQNQLKTIANCSIKSHDFAKHDHKAKNRHGQTHKITPYFTLF